MQRIIGFFIFYLIFLGLDFYLYRVFRVHFLQKPVSLRIFTIIWFFVPVLCAVFSFLSPQLGRTGKLLVMNVVMLIFLSLLIASLLVFIGDLARFTFNKISKSPTETVLLGRRKMLANVGVMLLAMPFGSLLFGLFKTAYNFKVHRISIKFPNLPEAFNGFKFAQLSDIHTGSFLKRDELDEAIELTLNEKPDVIFFTGDMVNNKTDEAYPFMDSLKKLQAPMGVFSTLGNHDYGDYERWPDKEAKMANMEAMHKLHADLGWTLLNNRHAVLSRGEGDHIKERIAVVGVENWGKSKHFPKKGDVAKAKAGAEDVPFKILLSHDPSHWDARVLSEHDDIDLMLSGHTHGFQFGIEIPGFKWSPSQWLYKQWAGLYQNGKQYLYVNRGLGCLGFSGRIGIRPEITIIELLRS